MLIPYFSLLISHRLICKNYFLVTIDYIQRQHQGVDSTESVWAAVVGDSDFILKSIEYFVLKNINYYLHFKHREIEVWGGYSHWPKMWIQC